MTLNTKKLEQLVQDTVQEIGKLLETQTYMDMRTNNIKRMRNHIPNVGTDKVSKLAERDMRIQELDREFMLKLENELGSAYRLLQNYRRRVSELEEFYRLFGVDGGRGDEKPVNNGKQ